MRISPKYLPSEASFDEACQPSIHKNKSARTELDEEKGD